jgi:hypothetical protein
MKPCRTPQGRHVRPVPNGSGIPSFWKERGDRAPGSAAIVASLPVNEGSVVGGRRVYTAASWSRDSGCTAGQYGIERRRESVHDVELRRQPQEFELWVARPVGPIQGLAPAAGVGVVAIQIDAYSPV